MNWVENDNGQMNDTRRSFLTATTGLGAVAAAGILGRNSAKAADAVTTQAKLDPARIAQQAMSFPGSATEFTNAFQSILLHENEHVVFLAQTLGSAARPKPTFKSLKQTDVKAFINLAVAFENTGSGAYLNAAPNIQNHQYIEASATIALVEARHAGFLNVATGQPITLGNSNFEKPIAPSDVMAAVQPYIASLNGGPPLTYSTTPSPANDIAILNFALALEYLEAEFYNINVPIFY